MKRTAQQSAAAFSAALVVVGFAGVAVAQEDGFDQVAPGYQSPDEYIEIEERPRLNGYGLIDDELPDTNLVDSGDGPITEFAGQRRQFNPGIIGGVLGSVKRSITGADE